VTRRGAALPTREPATVEDKHAEQFHALARTAVLIAGNAEHTADVRNNATTRQRYAGRPQHAAGDWRLPAEAQRASRLLWA
jgi:hypothetical protein